MSTQRIVKHRAAALARVTCLTGKRGPKLKYSFYRASETVLTETSQMGLPDLHSQNKQSTCIGCQIFAHSDPAKKKWVGNIWNGHGQIKYTHAESDSENFSSCISFLNGLPSSSVWGEVERFFSEIKHQCSNACHRAYKWHKLCWAGKCVKENPRTAENAHWWFTDRAHWRSTRAPSVCWMSLQTKSLWSAVNWGFLLLVPIKA